MVESKKRPDEETGAVTENAKKIKLDQKNLKPSQTLYVKNLNDQIHPKIIKHNLYLLFSTYGDVIDINNKKRGQAHIVFNSVQNASLALKCLQAEEFFDKELVINYSINESDIIARLKRRTEEEEGES
ncbi:uncharacterized protein RJT20DRAFT_5088 [Scheffersomyces xylosifermentans]|uniref:uncharacterized protein n=1 Tax=Scheffersomyces xylosifermentans TaxID=1304137 RepID=UPI00315D2410